MTIIHIKDVPTLNTQCLTHALDRLSCLDHYFSQSREYLIKHIRNNGQLHLPNSIGINLNIGLCGQIISRLHLSGINESEVETFMAYIYWRFFDNNNYPIQGRISDFSEEVQQAMEKTLNSFGPLIVEHYKTYPDALSYYWHQGYCSEYFPLMQYDSESPYGEKRLKLLKEMVKTLAEIQSYAMKIQADYSIKWPVIGSVIAPDELINKEK